MSDGREEGCKKEDLISIIVWGRGDSIDETNNKIVAYCLQIKN